MRLCLAMPRAMAAALLLTLLLSAAPVYAQKNVSHPQPTLVEQAEAAMDRSEWHTAEELLAKSTASNPPGNPKDARAWFDLGYVMHAEKNYPEAIAAYRKAAQLQPQSFECALNLGLMLAHEKHSEAEKVLERATTLKPSTDHANEAMARAWAALAELREAKSGADAANSARDAWSKAVAFSPTEDILVAYGQALERSGDASGAEKQYRAALAAKKDSRAALVSLVNLYLKGKQLAQAEEVLNALVAATPADENAHLQLGRVYSAEQKDDAAIVELKTALALRPDDIEALRELAYTEEHARQWTDAEKSYRALLEKEPQNAEALFGLGNSLLGQLKYKDAKETFIRCVQLRGNWPEAFGQLARAAQRDKDYELAIRALDARAKLAPELPSTYFLRAICYDSLKAYKPAAEYYRKFLILAGGKYPDEEFEARHRLKAIDPEEKNKR